MDRSARAIFRLAMFAVWTLLLVPAEWAVVALSTRLAERLRLLHFGGVCRIVGVKIERRGTMSPTRPTLFASNHTSYLDIIVLGSLIPGSFVAMVEIADWPLLGPLAKLYRTVFVERRSGRAGAQRDQMAARLAAGDNLILFPEGTSSDGIHVLPFKSALFSVAERRAGSTAVTVQPVSIAYSSVGGLPMPRYMRPYFAWYGDMELASHLWQVLRLAPVTVAVEFHPTAPIDRFESRKALAAHCHGVTAAGMSAALHGVRAGADRPEPRSRAA